MSKITEEHLHRAACVYVRQSSIEQVQNNHESRRRQYGLADKARALGFRDVVVVDEDLGRSGSGTARPGFERLLGLICDGRVGAVLAIEASRLARNGRDWHTLLELCGLVNAILIDEDGIYDPRHPNDRLLLGMKGTLSELELSLLRQRALEAIRAKAARGEHFGNIAMGYVRGPRGTLELDPDRRVRQAIALVFQKFADLQSARKVLIWLREHSIELPVVQHRDQRRTISWRPPTYTRVHSLLVNPVYAGAYVFGRSSVVAKVAGGRKRLQKIRVERSRWRVCLQGRHEGYIDWNTYLRNQTRLQENANMRGEAVRGSIRHGEALLTGLLRCGHCGRRLSVAYTGEGGRYARYYCRGDEVERMNRCISFSAWRVESAVANELLTVVSPLGIEASLKAIEARHSEGDDCCRHIELAMEQARFEARHAQRQYEAVDPENRLVAAELERRWNGCLQTIARLQTDLAVARQSTSAPLTPEEQASMLALGEDLPAAWHHPEANPEARKRIIRAAIREIMVRVANDEVQLVVHWQGGDHTPVVVRKNKTGEHRYHTSIETVELIEKLARQMPDHSIASLLNRLGKRTAHGLTWNEQRVRALRSDHSIAVFRDEERRERGEVTLEEAAKKLGTSKTTMHRLIERGIVPAQQVCKSAPWIISEATLAMTAVQTALQHHRGEAAPSDSEQAAFEFQ